MAVTRVWNITDGSLPGVCPQTLRVLGRVLVPGRSIAVEESLLKKAHKIHADVSRGLLFIGKTPPGAYLKAKKPARAKLASGVVRREKAIPAPAPVPALEFPSWS